MDAALFRQRELRQSSRSGGMVVAGSELWLSVVHLEEEVSGGWAEG